MMSNSEEINHQVKRTVSVHFRGDAKVPEGPVATAVELGVESAQTSSGGEEPDYQEVELGLLKPERRYEATICPVAEGTQLANVKESTGLNVTISRTESGDGQESGPAVACQLSTPKEGEIIHFFSADFVDESGAVKHRAFSIAGKVMSSDKVEVLNHSPSNTRLVSVRTWQAHPRRRRL